jgi:geranylgeranyl reductase family protein
MAQYDAIVVGGGPAGSTAARLLAEGGARVCVFDRARFPRSKPCGGALSPRILHHLPPGVNGVIRTCIRHAIFTFQSGKAFEISSAVPMGYLVCREEFDTWLLTRAKQAGALVREGTAVGAIEAEGTGFRVQVGSEWISTAAILGADGANSRVAAQWLPGRPAARYLALECEVPQDGCTLADTALVDVGAYPGGYAWAFPKRDRVNIGVMMEYAQGRALRPALSGFVAGQPLLPRLTSDGKRAAPVAAPRFGPVPCARPGLLLIGDAAQLADPFLGEGIYYAVRSGAMAAQALLQTADAADMATRYTAQIAAQIWPELAAASRVASLFHRMPRWWHHLLSRMPGSLSSVAGVLAGQDSYAGLLRQVVRRVEAEAGRWVRSRLRAGLHAEASGGGN